MSTMQTFHNSTMDKTFGNKQNLSFSLVTPSDSVVTTKCDCAVKLRIEDSGMAATEPVSAPSFLHNIAKQYPNNIAMIYKDEDGNQKSVTYRQYEESVRICSKAFLKLGLKRHHSVGIIAQNCQEWFISYFATIYAGGIAVGIHLTNSAEACYHCLKISNADIVVVDDTNQLEKILKIRNRLPDLKAIIQISASKPSLISEVYSWKDLMGIGSEECDKNLENIIETIAVNECLALVFTSGTTGLPKAAMLSHDNLIWSAHATAEYLGLVPDSNQVVMSFLPLSHVAAQFLDIFLTLYAAGTIYFPEKDVLKKQGAFVRALQEARPTFFFSVPRLWEKIYEKLLDSHEQSGIIKKRIFNWARRHILQHNYDKMKGINNTSKCYKLASKIVSQTVKAALGFDRCKMFISGGAPTSTDLRTFFMSLDIVIFEVFAMTESTATMNIENMSAFNLMSVGKTVSGIQTKIYKPDKTGEGEICCYGRNVFMGYLNDPEKTQETIDEDGFLHSGDIGKFDDDGYLYITGRIKELIITAGGENIPPLHIENLVKAELSCISNAVLIGDRRKFLSILLSLKTEVDMETGEPKDELTEKAKKWCENLGCEVNTVNEFLSGPNRKIMAAIQEGIDRVNENASSRAQRIQKFAILPRDFSLQTGELSSSLKVRRNVVIEKYAHIIEEFYKNC